MASLFTKVAGSTTPHSIQYRLQGNGTAGTSYLATATGVAVIADCDAGPLKTFLSRLPTGTWATLIQAKNQVSIKPVGDALMVDVDAGTGSRIFGGTSGGAAYIGVTTGGVATDVTYEIRLNPSKSR